MLSIQTVFPPCFNSYHWLLQLRIKLGVFYSPVVCLLNKWKQLLSSWLNIPDSGVRWNISYNFFPCNEFFFFLVSFHLNWQFFLFFLNNFFFIQNCNGKTVEHRLVRTRGFSLRFPSVRFSPHHVLKTSHRDVRAEQDAQHGHAVRVLDTRQPPDPAVVQLAVDAIHEVAAGAVVPTAHTEGRVLLGHAEGRTCHRVLLAGNDVAAATGLAVTVVTTCAFCVAVLERFHAGHVRVRHLLPGHGPSRLHTLRVLCDELPVCVRRKCLG